MRIPSAHRNSGGPDNSTMTPMIDVVFLLLIFFICASARQTREALLAATLPPGVIESAQTPAQTPVQVDQAAIRLKRGADGAIAAEMNGTDYKSLDLLEAQLKTLAAAATEVPIILDVDGPVPFGDVLRIYDLCQRLKFQTIKFAVDLRNKP